MATKNNQVVDEILNRCNIVDVIGSVVTLKKSGSNYKGICPFHNEKTPSFVVSETKQIFTCFGCHATGNVIKFVMLYYNLTFLEAIEKLANQYGIEFERNNYSSTKNTIYYDINTEAARFFYKALRTRSNNGAKYVFKRGLSKETLHDFGIGYADESWDSLYTYLKEKGFKEEDMLKVGLVSYSNGKYFDKFRNRVIFPIQNTLGKVIGFGGRALDNKQTPKYLNSPETPIFHKKNNLYGLNITKNYVNKQDEAILVEGYMDVVSLYQEGIQNVAASLGTALTESQAKLLKRYTKNVVLSYDADSAGRNASIRGSSILYKEGLKTKILHVTDGKDPDEYIKAHGKLAYRKIVDNALGYEDYIINSILNRHDIKTTDGKVNFLKEISNFFKTLSPIEADIYMEKVSKEYGISLGALKNEIESKDNFIENKHIERQESDVSIDTLTKIEQNIIKIILTDSKYLKKVIDKGDLFTTISGNLIVNAIKNIYKEDEEINIERLIESLNPDEVKLIKEINENISLGGKIDTIFEECLKSHREEALLTKQKNIIELLSITDEKENYDEIQRLTQELMEIQKELRRK